MRRFPTVFERGPDGYVTPHVTPGAEWVLDGAGTAVRLHNGHAIMFDPAGTVWAHRVVRLGAYWPTDFQLSDLDPSEGVTHGWMPAARSEWLPLIQEAVAVAVTSGQRLGEGTYELVGPKVKGNPDRFDRHTLIAHRQAQAVAIPARLGFTALRAMMLDELGPLGWKGVAWWRADGQCAVLRVSDFAR